MFRRISLILIFILFLFNGRAKAVEITDLDLVIKEANVFVSFRFNLDQVRLNEIKEGISKEFIFYIDLFRYWDVWPDEFITGKKIIRTITADPVKREFIATSFDGTTLIQKRFKSLESMIQWTCQFSNLPLVNMKPLPASRYFVKVTVESRLTKIPSLISELFFFLPVRDFKISKNSAVFRWPAVIQEKRNE